MAKTGWLLIPIVLLLVPLVHVSAQGDPPSSSWIVPDDSGDYGVFVSSPAPVPSNPAASSVDIVELRIENEDAAGLTLAVIVDELRVGAAGASNGDSLDLAVDFDFGPESLYYRIWVDLDGATEPDASSIFVAAPDGHWSEMVICGGDGCIYEPVEVAVSDEDNAVRIWIPKASLLGYADPDELDDRPRQIPATIKPGDLLSDIRVTTDYFPLSDVAPNVEAPPYSFQTYAANTVLRIYGADAAQTMPIQAGVNQTLTFNLMTTAAAKRLVQLEYSLQGPGAGKYHVTGPATVNLPAGETRAFNIALDAAPDASTVDEATLILQGASVGHPEEVAYLKLGLLPGALLGPSSNVLYLHDVHWANFVDAAPEVTCNGIVFGTCDEGVLSPLQGDPKWSDDRRIHGYRDFGPGTFTNTFWIYSPDRLSAPVNFADDGTIETVLKLVPPTAVTGARIEAHFAWWDGEDYETFFGAQTTSDLQTAGTAVTLTGPAQLGGEKFLSAGTGFTLYVRIAGQLSPTFAAAWGAGGIEIVPVESQIRLPLIDLPEELRNDVLPSPFQLLTQGDHDDYVNPGEARLYNVSVLNQDLLAHRLQLSNVIDHSGWVAEVLPGTTYDLASGDLITVGVLVHAPTDAREGDSAVVRLNATDENGNSISILLNTTATAGVDLPDDAGRFRADADTEDKVIDDGAVDTPGFAGVAAILAAGFLVRRISRRKA